MVSIIIPTLGRPTLDRLLGSLGRLVAEKGLKPDVDFEVVICIDERSAPRSHQASVLRAKAVASSGRGVNRARNEGARQSRGEILWFLDDDTELVDAEGVLILNQAFTSPKRLAVGGNYLSAATASFSERGYNALCSLWRTSAGENGAEQLLGGTLAVRRSAWLAAGGFDDEIEYGGAETPFVARLIQLARRDLGADVFFDQGLNVRHHPGARGWAEWARVAFRQGRQKRATGARLPTLRHRLNRAIFFLKNQDARTLFSLGFFSVPFLLVSICGAKSLR